MRGERGERAHGRSICCCSAPITPLEECVSVTEEGEEYLPFLNSGSQMNTDTGPFQCPQKISHLLSFKLCNVNEPGEIKKSCFNSQIQVANR